MNKTQWIRFYGASFMLMTLMGSVYAYGAIRLSIERIYLIDIHLSGYPYMISLFCYALSMMITGRFLKIEQSRKIAFIGVITLMLGYLISYLSSTFFFFTLGYGVLIGLGVGMIYGIPIKIIALVEKKQAGYYTGWILLAFGISPLVTAPLIKGIENAFGFQAIWLIFFFVWVFLGIPLTRQLTVKDVVESTEVSTIKNKKTFLSLYLLFFIATSIGLTMIGLSSKIGASFYAYDEAILTKLLMIFALSNGIARPIMGKIIDKYDIKTGITLSTFLVISASIIALLNQGQSLILYTVSYSIFWFNLGAWLTLIPVSVRRLEGNTGYSKRYGLMFTAYGFGAIMGTSLSGSLLNAQTTTHLLYLLIIGFVLVQYLIFQTIKHKLIHV